MLNGNLVRFLAFMLMVNQVFCLYKLDDKYSENNIWPVFGMFLLTGLGIVILAGMGM